MKVRKTISALAAAAMLLTCAPNAAVLAATDDSAQPEQAQTEQTQTVQPEAPEVQAAADLLPYQDESLSFEERAADLVARMTLEEKAAQTAAKNAPAISRLGVQSYYYWREGIHGVARQGKATSFPSSLAMSNTWDTALMQTAMDITSTEARAINPKDLNYWNPTINMARDPRWGRNEESYGEDPYLTSEIGSAAVRGMQGTDDKYLKTMTTLKHYAANNVEGERFSGTSIMNERTMREYYTRAFRDITKNADPAAVMSSYNGSTVYRNGEILTSMDGQKIDYIASSANSYLLNDLLRRTYGFGGFVVGDCGAWDNAFGQQPLRKKLYPELPLDQITSPMTVSKIVSAGSSLDCNSGGAGTTQVASAVQQGLLSEEALDIMVYELFLQRMKTGEFDKNPKYKDISKDVVESDESVAVAEKAAEESWVMLENKNNALPLKEKSGGYKVAVVGNLANKLVLGDYSGSPTKTKTPVEGIKEEIQKKYPGSEINHLGAVSDDELLFNLKSLTLVLNDGKTREIDLSKAENVAGMTQSGTALNDMTPKAYAVIKDVDFKDVKSIRAEIATGDRMGGTVNIAYSEDGVGGINVANIEAQKTDNIATYATCEAPYDGALGGYVAKAHLIISATPAVKPFTVESYKTELDNADFIVAYGCTVPKQDGLGTVDASESHDRSSINMPSSQAHVQQICDAYPNKTIVALQTVGQMNVEGFKDKCAALLWTSYNGQTQGTALGKILTGDANPSGRLSTTWYAASDLDKMPLGSSKTTQDNIGYNFTNYELASDINNPGTDYPGRTYQYYTGTPVYPFGYGKSYTSFEYSNIKIDKATANANDTVTITADVKNTGSVAGDEVAQLYITVPGADGKKLPLKQLKGFERLTLNPGETKTATFSLNIADVYFFDEAKQQNYVIPGEYTAKVGANANDANAQQIKFTVSGDISESVDSVYAIPSGLKLYSVNNGANAANSISANASVTLKNDKVITDFAANGITMTYKSSNENVAKVDENGTVTAGAKEGVAMITATASKADGSSASYSFPVVSRYRDGISAEKKAEYLARLDAAYAACPELAYTPENWQKLNDIYSEIHSTLESALIDDGLELSVSEAIDAMLAVPKIELSPDYTIEASAGIITDGVIEYSENGIGKINATSSSISGTITESDPAKISLSAMSGGSAVNDGLIWTVERLDGSGRKNPEINVNTGELTLYTNGVYKITAANYTSGKSGELTVYAALQLEGENADDNGGGANLNDTQAGTSGGKDAGSTTTRWLRFDGVMLKNLTGITARVSKEKTDSVINLSLMPNTDWMFATGTIPATGSYDTWEEVNIGVTKAELDRLTLDENGCGTIYVQTNGACLDYIMPIYNNSNMTVTNEAGGTVSVTTDAASGTLLAASYDSAGALTASSIKPIASAGEYKFDGFKDGDRISLFEWNNTDAVAPIGKKADTVYSEPIKKDMIVYNLSDPAYDAFFDSAGGAQLIGGLGLDGFGGWATDKGGTFKYNGKTLTFTRSLKAGRGDRTTTCVYFTPDSDGVATAVFNANTERCIYIDQEDGSKIEQYGTGSISAAQMNVKAGKPVYVYGGGSNKNLYAVLFEPGAEVVESTPTPAPTATPTPEPLPEVVDQKFIEFEDYTKCWPEADSKRITTSDVAGASGGKVVDNTKDKDTFYFGEVDTDNLVGIELNVGTKQAGVTVEYYLVDMNGTTPDAAQSSKLTDDNRIGAQPLTVSKNWNDFINYQTRVRGAAIGGKKGLFVKGKVADGYVGNFDYIQLLYGKAGAAAEANSEALLTAENDSAIITVQGSDVTSVNKYTGEVSAADLSEEYGDISVEKLTVWNGMLTAMAKNSGGSKLLTSPMGTVWIDATPDYYAESDPGAPKNPVINDMLEADGQMYLGCDGGWLITMNNCTKCTTIKKVCDFDIKGLDSDGETLYLSGDGENAEIAIADARQENIKADAAKELIAAGALPVDVRSAEEFAEDSIDGSVNVPVDEFEQWLGTQDKNETIIVYCASGNRAGKAAEIAKEQGFKNIYNAGSINDLK